MKQSNYSILKENYYVGLAFYRVILSFIVLKNCIFYLPLADVLFGKGGIYPVDSYAMALSYSGIFGKLGIDTFIVNLFNSPLFPTLYLIVCIVFFSMLLLGVGKRTVAVISYILILNLMWRNPYILDGSDNVIQVTFPFLIFTNCFKYLTWNKGLNNISNIIVWKGETLTQKQAFVRLLNDFGTLGIKIQVCFVYFFTGLAKLQGSLWLNGTAVYYTMRVSEFRATNFNIPLTENHYFVVFTTYFTILWELAFIFLVWFKQTKNYVLLFGVFLHLGIWFFMRIDNFSWIMIGTYFLFLTDSEYQFVSDKITKVRSYLAKRKLFLKRVK